MSDGWTEQRYLIGFLLCHHNGVVLLVQYRNKMSNRLSSNALVERDSNEIEKYLILSWSALPVFLTFQKLLQDKKQKIRLSRMLKGAFIRSISFFRVPKFFVSQREATGNFSVEKPPVSDLWFDELSEKSKWRFTLNEPLHSLLKSSYHKQNLRTTGKAFWFICLPRSFFF